MSEEDLRWETRNSTVAYSCPGFDVRNESVVLPDGTETDFDYVDEPESVVILPFTEDGDVVVIEEWRQAVRRVNRGLPVGGLEPEDEDRLGGAHRELAEETGYEAERMDHLVTVEPANGIANAVLHYFVAYDCTPTAERALDFNESIKQDTTTFDALRSDVADGAVRDGRTVTGVLYYDAFGEL